jgi:hypothetical protein
MSTEEELENQGFKVKDRRRFHPDGTPIDSEAEAAPPPEEKSSEEKAPGVGAKADKAADIPADFSSLLLSVAAGAQVALGIAPHPASGKVEKNLLQAKYSIDLLGMLQEKTKGNLSSEEAQLLEALLYDLRMRYVEAKPS